MKLVDYGKNGVSTGGAPIFGVDALTPPGYRSSFADDLLSKTFYIFLFTP